MLTNNTKAALAGGPKEVTLMGYIDEGHSSTANAEGQEACCVPLHSDSSARAYLGACLQDNSLLDAVPVRTKDLPGTELQKIHRVMLKQWAAGPPVDEITVGTELSLQGNEGYWHALVGGLGQGVIPQVGRVARYAAEIQRAADQRCSVRFLDDSRKAMEAGRLSFDDLGDKFAKFAADRSRASGNGKIRRLADVPNLQTMEIPGIDYLVPGMIARKTLTLWTGADGTAKTYLALLMEIAVAGGGRFLGRQCQQADVLHLDYENPSFAIRDRLDVMTGGTVVPRLKVWGTWLEQQPPPIGSDLLLTIAKESQPLMIFDPFRYAHAAEENDSTAMMGIMQSLRSYAAAGAAVVILHHPARSEGSTGRGSTAIKGAVDLCYLQEMADPNDGGLITLKCIKNRFGETLPITIRPNFEDGTFEVTDSPQFVKRTDDTQKLLDIITAEPGLAQNAIYHKAGMRKARCLELLKSNRESLWLEEKRGHSLAYFPIVPKTGNSHGNSGTGQGVKGCSSVPIPLDGNREQSLLAPKVVPGTVAEKPDGKTMPSCPACGGFAVDSRTNPPTCFSCEPEAIGRVQ